MPIMRVLFLIPVAVVLEAWLLFWSPKDVVKAQSAAAKKQVKQVCLKPYAICDTTLRYTQTDS